MRRAPYAMPCDVDPVDKGRLTGVFYGAKPCRGRTFPGGTSVIAFLASSANHAMQLARPLRTLVWVGGRYFRTRTTFPIHVGDSAARARRLLGPARASFHIPSRRPPFVEVRRYRSDVHLLYVNGRVLGVALGPMPRDPTREPWRAVHHMIVRYTPLPAWAVNWPAKEMAVSRPAGKPSGLCARLWRKALRCQRKSRIAREIVRSGAQFSAHCGILKRRPGGLARLRCFLRASCARMDRCKR